VSVLIFMPGPAGMAQDATGLGLFSTCMRRHDAPHTQTRMSICAVIPSAAGRGLAMTHTQWASLSTNRYE
jgi:hypothetical protein